MPTLLVLQGLPGAGKTTFAKQLMQEKPEQKFVRICRDELYQMAHMGERSPENAELTDSLRFATIGFLLRQGYSVIDDDTNWVEVDVIKLQIVARSHKAEFVVHWVNTPMEVCAERNANSPEPVSKETMGVMYRCISSLHERYLPDPLQAST